MQLSEGTEVRSNNAIPVKALREKVKQCKLSENTEMEKVKARRTLSSKPNHKGNHLESDFWAPLESRLASAC